MNGDSYASGPCVAEDYQSEDEKSRMVDVNSNDIFHSVIRQ